MNPLYLQACAEQMPLAWPGLAGCRAEKLPAVVCVCSACEGGRTAALEPACGQTQSQREELPQGADNTSTFH